MTRFVLAAVILTLILLGPLPAVSADRIVLAPRGMVTPAGTIRLEAAALARNGRINIEWLSVGIPPRDLGLELEAERSDMGGDRGEDFSLQYTLTGNGITEIAPALTIGLRDLLNRGFQGRSVFAAVTKTIGMSRRQENVTRDLKVHVGIGTGPMHGLFAGVENRFTFGFTAAAEYAGGRFNAAVAFPMTRYGRVRAYSLDGAFFYGLTLSVQR